MYDFTTNRNNMAAIPTHYGFLAIHKMSFYIRGYFYVAFPLIGYLNTNKLAQQVRKPNGRAGGV